MRGRLFDGDSDVESTGEANGLAAVFPQTDPAFSGPSDIPFDLVANAFYFLSSWSERKRATRSGSRQLRATSVFARLGIPQDIVDRYLERLRTALASLRDGQGGPYENRFDWPSEASFAVVALA